MLFLSHHSPHPHHCTANFYSQVLHNLQTLLLSAKKAMGQGIELNFDAYLTEQLLVTLNGSVNMTKIKDPNLAVGTCAQCTPTDPTVATYRRRLSSVVLS